MSPSPLPHPPYTWEQWGTWLLFALPWNKKYFTLHSTPLGGKGTGPVTIHTKSTDGSSIVNMYFLCVLCVVLTVGIFISYIIYLIIFFPYNYLSLCLQLFQSGRCSFSLYFDLFVYFSFARYQFLHQILTFPRGASHNVTKENTLQNISVNSFWNITNELLEFCRFLVFKCFCIFCNVRIWSSTCLHCVSVLCSVCIQLEAKIFLQVVIILASFHKIILSPPFPALLKGYPWTLWLFHPNGQWLRPI